MKLIRAAFTAIGVVVTAWGSWVYVTIELERRRERRSVQQEWWRR